MKILTGRQIREADRATVEREGISSLELMERAAEEIARWIAENVEVGCRLVFCCGKGGNGGDGLAAARILTDAGRECALFLGADPNELSEEARANFARLPEGVRIYDITAERPDIEPDDVIVDALLGVGVTGEVREPVRGVIEWLNSLPNRLISIDIPSGMATEWGSGRNGDGESNYDESVIVRAETTLTIGFPKLSLLQPETGEYAGGIVVLPIGLDEKFLAGAGTPYHYITEEWVESLRRPRAKFSHKGNYGHALLVCGSELMPGAAVLAAGGAVRSGCGLVTVHIPKTERFALTANHPSAMLSLDGAECFSTLPDGLDRFSAIGVGPGLGRDPRTVEALGELLSAVSVLEGENPPRPLVLDADALNIVAENPHLKQLIPVGSVMTPHPGELRRLVGEWADDREKLEKASRLAAEISGVMIVKGAHSVVCTPDGRFIFNSTGTPGMAKGGCGDVLAGLLTGLLARGYDTETASVIGVYMHGRAGERAAELYGEEAMNASDLAEFFTE
jgi:NAD(P)H-hydrate epimerase